MLCILPMFIFVHIVLLIRNRRKFFWHLSLSVWGLAGAHSFQPCLQHQVAPRKANVRQIGSFLRCPPAYSFLILSTHSLAQSLGPEVYSRGFDKNQQVKSSLQKIYIILKFIYCSIQICTPSFLSHLPVYLFLPVLLTGIAIYNSFEQQTTTLPVEMLIQSNYCSCVSAI